VISVLLPPVPIKAAELKLVLLLSAAMFVGVFNSMLDGLALKHIQNSIGMHDSDVGGYVAIIRLGVLPAVLLAMASDMYGRRRLLMITIIGVMLASVATAFVTTPGEFVTAQFFARMFAVAEDFLSIVVLVEELRPELRGWGLGAFGAMGAVGAGVAAALFAFIDVIPGDWRTLYVLGTVPMICIAWFRRSLPETQKFTAQHGGRRPPRAIDAWRPLIALFRDYPGRLLVLAAIAGPFGFALSTSLFYVSKFLQEAHGFSPAEVAMTYLLPAGIPLMGNFVAGKYSDLIGRRRMLASGFVIAGLGALVLYTAASSWLTIAGLLLTMFAVFGLDVLIGALGAELFPTSYRATSSAARAIVLALSAAAGLMCESMLFPLVGGHAQAIVLLLITVPIGGLVAWFFLVETATRGLDSVSPEKRYWPRN